MKKKKDDEPDLPTKKAFEAMARMEHRTPGSLLRHMVFEYMTKWHPHLAERYTFSEEPDSGHLTYSQFQGWTEGRPQ